MGKRKCSRFRRSGKAVVLLWIDEEVGVLDRTSLAFLGI